MFERGPGYLYSHILGYHDVAKNGRVRLVKKIHCMPKRCRPFLRPVLPANYKLLEPSLLGTGAIFFNIEGRHSTEVAFMFPTQLSGFDSDCR